MSTDSSVPPLQRDLERKIKESKELRDQFVSETPLIEEKIETLRLRLVGLYEDD
jgi:hypothetical protein